MRLKLDENLGLRHAELLRQAGHEVDTVHDESLSGAADDAVLAAAWAADRALVTLDLDFADPLRFPPEATAGIVVLRPHPHPVRSGIDAALAQLVAGLGRSDVTGRLWGRRARSSPPVRTSADGPPGRRPPAAGELKTS